MWREGHVCPRCKVNLNLEAPGLGVSWGMDLTWDLWRHIFSFLALSDLQAVFCVKFFQPAWQHQHFWITRFLQDFPFRQGLILIDPEVYRPWPEIREKYRKCILKRARDFRRINVKDVSILPQLLNTSQVSMVRPRHGLDKVPIRITTPACHFPYGMLVVAQKCFLTTMLTDALVAGGDPLMREFYAFLRQLEEQIIQLTAENQWLGAQFSTVDKCREFYQPPLSNVRYTLKLNLVMKGGEILSKLYDAEGERMPWNQFTRGARGSMVICCQSYFVLLPRQAFGVKWYVEQLHLEKNSEQWEEWE